MGHQYTATVAWRRLDGEDFGRGRYSRAHEWRFDGGVTVPASASPGVVPAPFVRLAAVDPEEALVAALSSCHMLTFLDLARRAGFLIDAYEDQASGTLEEIEPKRLAITRVTLRPRLVWNGLPPDRPTLERLHAEAHRLCFISNSVTTKVSIESPD